MLFWGEGNLRIKASRIHVRVGKGVCRFMVTLTPCQSVLTLHRRKENVVCTESVGFVRSVYSKRRKMQNGVVEAIQKQCTQTMSGNFVFKA